MATNLETHMYIIIIAMQMGTVYVNLAMHMYGY